MQSTIWKKNAPGLLCMEEKLYFDFNHKRSTSFRKFKGKNAETSSSDFNLYLIRKILTFFLSV